jgi:transcriptional regulator with XRE-family HTH domain
MVKQGDPEVDRLVVKFLRSRVPRLTQEDFGRAAGVDQGDVSRYELGHLAPPEETLRRMAAVVGVPWTVVVSLRRFYAAVLSAVARANPGSRPAGTAAIEQAILDSVLLAVTPYLVEEETAEPDLPSPEEALREADEIWKALESFPPDRRRRLIELSPRPAGNVALARRIDEASAQAAAHSAAEAAELADLALFTARQVP